MNAVFDILLRFTESGSWKEAFFQVIPKRKQVQHCSGADAKDCSDVTCTDVAHGENTTLLLSATDTQDVPTSERMRPPLLQNFQVHDMHCKVLTAETTVRTETVADNAYNVRPCS